ncbi:MAG: ATP-binding protein [Chloroherpetonaceae bacterium]|nr:ATP-binding protein [Chloroherpetonaceae bacterium]MDW8437923.1 ATP-binding protein [Chloroherpetonaceae bacterium]
MRREIQLLQENAADLAREAVALLNDQINFSLEKFTEKELRDFFKAFIHEICLDLADETFERARKFLLKHAEFLQDLRIDERLRLALAAKKVLLKSLASMTVYASATAVRLSELIDQCVLEMAYDYEIEAMKSETSDELVADEIADELYKTRRKLERQKKFINSLLENSPDAIALLDARRKIVMWNEAASELFGYKQSQLLGKSLEKLAVDESLARSVLKEAERKGKVYGAELPMTTQDQRQIPVSMSVSGIESASEKEANFLVVMRDASELRKMRDKIIDAERLSAMAKIAGAVAHEVRNPLNSIILNLDLLEDELPSRQNDRLAKQLAIFREEIEKLNAIVTNYLSLSRLTKSDFKIKSVQAVLDGAIERFAQMMSEKLAEENRTLVVRKRYAEASETLFAMIDENQFSRVLLNLAQNAVEAASKEKRVEMEVALWQKEKSVVIEIQDNGEGVAEETREKLFTPFFSTKSGGTGLGLYIVREIMDAHRGEIELRNRPTGKGAIARLSLPLVDAPKAASVIEE